MKRTIVILSSVAVFTAFAAFTTPAHARGSAKHQRIQACADKSAGDPCSYTRKGENVDGTCGSGRHGKLICTASNAGTSEPSGGAMTAPGSAGSDTGGATGSPSGEPAGGAMGAPSGGGEAPAPSAP